MPGPTRRSKPLKGGSDVGDITGILISNPADGDLLVYDAADSRWENTKNLTGNYSLAGQLSLTTLSVSGASTLTGAVTTGTDLTVGGALAVTGNTTLAATTLSTLTATGAVTLQDTLSVAGLLTGAGFSFSGNGTVTGSLTVSGAFNATIDLSSDDVTVLSLVVTNNAVVGGQLSVAGNIAGAAVSGTAFIGDTLALTDTLEVSGAATLNSTLAVTGTSTLTGAVTAATTLGVTGATTLGSTLGVTGASTLAGLTCTTLTATGAGQFDTTLDVTGNFEVNNMGRLSGAGNDFFVDNIVTGAGNNINFRVSSAGTADRTMLKVEHSNVIAAFEGTDVFQTRNNGIEAISPSGNPQLRLVEGSTSRAVIFYQITDHELILRAEETGSAVEAQGAGNVVLFRGITGGAFEAYNNNQRELATQTNGVLIDRALEIDGNLDHDGSNIGFFGTTPTTKKTVTGSRAGNAALASLLTQLAAYGFITDSTTA